MTWGKCYEKAGEICGSRGYKVLEKSSDKGATVTWGMYGLFGGSTITRSMIIKCGEPKRPAAKKQTREVTKLSPSPSLKEIATDNSFTIDTNGIVKDTRTGLEWVAGPDRDTTWHAAKTWVENLSTGRDGWRMPTLKELRSLYQKGLGFRNMTALLRNTGRYVWSGETKGHSSARFFNFQNGNESWATQGYSTNLRGFAVRSE